MTYEYKHKIDLSQLEEIATGNAALEAKYMRLLIAYARELEERIEKMRAAGNNMASLLQPYATDDVQTLAIETWRNA